MHNGTMHLLRHAACRSCQISWAAEVRDMRLCSKRSLCNLVGVVPLETMVWEQVYGQGLVERWVYVTFQCAK